MNFFKAAWGALTGLFGAGGSDGGKSIVQEAADVVDRFHPSPVKEHEMAVEDVQVGDASQSAARSMQFQSSGTDWFNKTVDGLNRLPRPLFAFWAFGELAGILPTPPGINAMNPIVLNIIWTIIGFYFGIRTISQDLPKAVQAWYQVKAMMK